jgi:asparagine synthase (glutamine-hydrolysing)
MEELLNLKDIRQEGLFNSYSIEKLKQEHLSDVANHSHILWSLMVFQAWRRRWLEGG